MGPSVFDLSSSDQLNVINAAADVDTDVARLNVPHRNGARGTDQLRSRKLTLTPAQESEIVELNPAGRSAETLAAQFGVGRSTIYRAIAEGETG